MPRKFTYVPRKANQAADRQWGWLNEEIDDLYSSIVAGLPVTVTQANSFTTGDVVGISGGVWAKAQAGSIRALGVVETASASAFDMRLSGTVMPWAGHGLTVPSPYYLSASTPGAVTTALPPIGTETQQILVPINTDQVLIHIMEYLS